MTFAKTLAAAAIAAITFAAPVNAATFAAWEITNVPFGDTLNVRKYPSSSSQKQAAYPNETVLQMTGRCTNGLNLFDIAGEPEAQQAAKVRFLWCEIWHDPAQNGKFVTGWAYGKYLKPY